MLLDTRSDMAASPADNEAERASFHLERPWSADLKVPLDTDLWVFGYGSLMWNPGFPYVERVAGVVKGYHRRFCVASHRYRGTPERPGLVLGLDRGGTCRGVAFRVAASHTVATLDYLWDREMISRVYRPKMLRVRLAGGRMADACAFTVDRGHGQYCGCLERDDIADRIVASVGERGPNLDYLVNTVAHLEDMGIHDRGLRALLEAVRHRLGGTGP